MLSDFVPDFDATVVARLKNAGAVLMGKLSLPEFSFGGSPAGGGEFPDAANPWDLSRTPGGSSSGSGAALAAGLVIAATGGDTSGSIRNPAALCGVVGMKPTYGRVSRHGIVDDFVVARSCRSDDALGRRQRGDVEHHCRARSGG